MAIGFCLPYKVKEIVKFSLFTEFDGNAFTHKMFRVDAARVAFHNVEDVQLLARSFFVKKNKVVFSEVVDQGENHPPANVCRYQVQINGRIFGIEAFAFG